MDRVFEQKVIIRSSKVNMNKIWMPVTAGVLDIINGASATVFGLLLIIMIPWVKSLRSLPLYSEFIGPILFIAGILAIVGGIYTIKKRSWLFALTGAIAGFISTSWWLEYWVNITTYGLSLDTLRGLAGIPAIIAIILIIRSRKLRGSRVIHGYPDKRSHVAWVKRSVTHRKILRWVAYRLCRTYTTYSFQVLSLR